MACGAKCAGRGTQTGETQSWGPAQAGRKDLVANITPATTLRGEDRQLSGTTCCILYGVCGGLLLVLILPWEPCMFWLLRPGAFQKRQTALKHGRVISFSGATKVAGRGVRHRLKSFRVDCQFSKGVLRQDIFGPEARHTRASHCSRRRSRLLPGLPESTRVYPCCDRPVPFSSQSSERLAGGRPGICQDERWGRLYDALQEASQNEDTHVAAADALMLCAWYIRGPHNFAGPFYFFPRVGC